MPRDLRAQLEYLNRDATDRALDKMGATPTDRNGPAAARTVEHLSVHEAVAHLVAVTGLRDKVCDAVFKYWREKASAQAGLPWRQNGCGWRERRVDGRCWGRGRGWRELSTRCEVSSNSSQTWQLLASGDLDRPRSQRKKRDKPLLRQLEAATNPQDTNPFHVFRPREKQHRPQTRRRRCEHAAASILSHPPHLHPAHQATRLCSFTPATAPILPCLHPRHGVSCRENDLKSYERLRELRENLAAALSIMELVVQRETKKRELAAHEVDEQRLQLRLHHEEGSRHDQVAGQMLQALKDRARRALEDGGGVPAPVPDVRGVRTGRGVGGRRGGLRGARGGRNPASAMAELPLAPLPPEIYAPFDETELDVSRFEKALLFTLPRGIRCEGVRARFGRGGRLVLDRCNPLTVELYWSRDQPDGNGVGEPMDVDGAPPR